MTKFETWLFVCTAVQLLQSWDSPYSATRSCHLNQGRSRKIFPAFLPTAFVALHGLGYIIIRSFWDLPASSGTLSISRSSWGCGP